MKIVLAGSPAMVISTFEKIIQNFDVVAIITQPDKKQGRKMQKKATPVATLASKYKIPIFKPDKIISTYEQLKKLKFDLFLTFAFGQWIPTKILKLGIHKPLNIHGSLLPKYRGAAPVHWAILNGDKKIGVTLMEMIKEMDAGSILSQVSQRISEKTNTGQAFKIIENLAKNNIVNWLTRVKQNKVNFQKQGPNFSLAPKITKTFAKLNLFLTTEEAIRKIRGLNPTPGAYLYVENKRVKIFEVSFQNIKGTLPLKFKNKYLYATDYQFESKRRKII